MQLRAVVTCAVVAGQRVDADVLAAAVRVVTFVDVETDAAPGVELVARSARAAVTARQVDADLTTLAVQHQALVDVYSRQQRQIQDVILQEENVA